ncbi:MAG: FG-GAP-like repeat-containing protein [Candidatus Contendobacter sp.]
MAPFASPAATLNIQVLDELGEPVVESIVIFVDGVQITNTDNTGQTQIQISEGKHRIGAVIPEMIAGVTDIEVAGNGIQEATVQLSSGEALALIRNYTVQVEESMNGILHPALTSFSIRVNDDNNTLIPLASIGSVTLETQERELDPSKLIYANISNDVSLLADGRIVASDIDGLKSILAQMPAKIKVTVLADDSAGLVYWDSVNLEYTSDSAANHILTVNNNGNGNGTVTGNGINCGSDCTESYASGTSVTLTAAPANGSTFTGWGGACSGTGNCAVTMDAAKGVTATFNTTAPNTYTLTVSKAGMGTGIVTGTGIDCGGDCGESYTAGTFVTLTATPTNDSTFAGWSGACSGTSTCAVTMDAAKGVTASFNTTAPTTYILTVSKAGTGTGTVIGTDINCGSDCTESYASGTSVTLTATAASGSTFAGWSGACSGTSTCAVTMDAAKGVTATFNTTVPNTYILTISKAGTGTGTVIGNDINCGSDCTESYASGTSVTLTATAASGSTFAGWSGACINATGTCTVSMTAEKSVTATFTVGSSSLQLAGLAANDTIWYTSNLTSWINIPGLLNQLQIGDFNGDGKADLAGLASNGSIWHTTNLGTWTQIPGALSRLVVGDFNSDGKADLAGVASNGSIWHTTNLGTWTQIPGALARIVTGDFNGDGKADLAGVASNGSIWYTTNRSTWTQIPGGLSQMIVGDFDGNGRSDLAGLAGDGSIWYTTNLSTWTRIPGALNRLAAGDFNGDGQDDLAGVASNGSIWYTTNLSTWTRIPGALSRLVAGKFGGDGQADLAGLAGDGSIWYTTNLSAWTQIPGQLNRLAGDD